ncbi:MAG: twin-arginine translocase TatA/TatE family subunit [Nitrososphaerota archaeon]|nr:twin-arginine translocase TatA/TatE family subunit [Nitrososphaerota archaeon]
MALDALEIGVIALMGIAVFIWGPEKVPEIARTIGNARKQLDGYTRQLQGISKELQTSMDTGNFDNLGNVLTGAAAGPLSGSPTTESAGSTAPSGTQTPAAPSSPLAAPAVKSGDQLLLEMAKQLRITTQGKTRDEIQAEILARFEVPVEAQTPQTPQTPQAAQSAPAESPAVPSTAPSSQAAT